MINSKTYNPDCDDNPDQRDLDAYLREQAAPPAEPVTPKGEYECGHEWRWTPEAGRYVCTVEGCLGGSKPPADPKDADAGEPMELKPCPFCGGNAGEFHWTGQVGCLAPECGAFAANLPIEQWNRRADPAALAAAE